MPRIAAPATRAAPTFARTQRPSRAATRFERRRIAEPTQRQITRSRSSSPATTASVPSQRLQQLQSSSRLSRSQRRELRTLQRAERRNAGPNIDRSAQAQTAQQNRLQQLQSSSRLSRSQRRELRTLQRAERRNASPNIDRSAEAQTAQQNRLQQLQGKRRLNRSERRELHQLQRDERQNARQQQQQPAAAAALPNREPRAMRTHAVSAQQAERGRFASGLRANGTNAQARLAGRRAARLAARTAWQLGLLAPYVPWRGPVYWPYAYNDLFYYTFWPEAYDPGYWAYAYDDFFDGVFFPDGAPYIEYAAEGPYSGPDGRVTTGSAPSRAAAPGRITQATQEFCADQAKGVTAWPLKQIADAVQPNEDQKALLEDLRNASEAAAAQFKDACPSAVPMTPPGRLQAMVLRLKATDDAVQTVKPVLAKFYDSLNDEQKARFNEIGTQLGQPRQPGAKQAQAKASCSGEKAGISDLAINRVEETVRPSDTQGAALDRLDEAMQKAVDALRAACPDSTAQTPVGRLDAMQKRLEAMIDAANTVRPALEAFYASLDDEQKAKFNRLGRETTQSGG
jgi:hypothetical protein